VFDGKSETLRWALAYFPKSNVLVSRIYAKFVSYFSLPHFS